MKGSIGHVEFIGDYEYYEIAGGDLYRAKINGPIMLDGRRCGRFECTRYQVAEALKIARKHASRYEPFDEKEIQK